MIDTLVFNQKWTYESNRLIRSFFPPQRFRMLYNTEPPTDHYLLTDYDKTVIKDGDIVITEYEDLPDGLSDEQSERAVCHAIYRALARYTGQTLGWGLLTGVRPVKYILKKSEAGLLDSYFTDKLLIQPHKLSLAHKISDIQKPIRAKLHPRGYSLYVSIPFCPSRCSYCSFVSHSVDTAARLIPEYLDCLCRELAGIRAIAERKQLVLQSIYLGGGTPTVLTASELRLVLDEIAQFPTRHLLEYTVEAGRPETITAEKLALLQEYNVSRISINPQTLSDTVLETIGRRHTVEDFFTAYALADKMGFHNINVDLIAGLPSGTLDIFKDTLDRIISLAPACITVHSLSLKRASALYHDTTTCHASDVGKMIEYAYSKLSDSFYLPYYLYRQKNTLENHENIGYAKQGAESFYNIVIMEELSTILSAGCGASTKLVDSDKSHIKRIFHPKYPYEYIRDFSEVQRKNEEGILGGF